ncbi:MAG: response regulator [Candidatus Krumholzibacteriia bacterium]
MNDKTPLVYVVDDDPAFCRYVATLFGTVGLRTASYGSGEQMLQALDGDGPGCIVLDVRLPDLSGLQVLERLAARTGCPPVIIVTGHADVPMAVQALKAGALDFLQKPVRNQDLLEKVQLALARDAVSRPEQARKAAVAARLAALTPREGEVLAAIVAGQANKIIAADLGLSMKTVEFHRSRVMRKMEADSLADLVRDVLLVKGE